MKIWSSLGYSIFYCYLGLTSIKFAKEGLLGAVTFTFFLFFLKIIFRIKEHSKQVNSHPEDLLTLKFSFISAQTLSVWIIATYLDIFSCDFHQVIVSRNSKLIFHKDTKCPILHARNPMWLLLASLVHCTRSLWSLPLLSYLQLPLPQPSISECWQ